MKYRGHFPIQNLQYVYFTRMNMCTPIPILLLFGVYIIGGWLWVDRPLVDFRPINFLLYISVSYAVYVSKKKKEKYH